MLNNSLSLAILTLKIHNISDVVLARQRARQLAELLKFDVQSQTKIATVVSEIARNACQYAGGGKIEYFLNNYLPASLVIKISDTGPGINNLDEIFAKKYHSKTGSGLGIVGSKNIMDRFTINTIENKGTTVIAEMYLMQQAPEINVQLLAKITDELARHRPKSASEEVQQQNQELLQALDLLNKAHAELEARVEERTMQLADSNKSLQKEMVERKRMEAWMLDNQQDLAVVERVNSMGEMASALAHELNSPLAIITSYAQGCMRRIKSGKYETDELFLAMEKVAHQSIRAGEIIHRMKNFVRQGELSREITDINQVIRETITLMQHEIEKNKITIQLNLQMINSELIIDAIQVQQVLINLMRNAFQALREANTAQPTVLIQTALKVITNEAEAITVVEINVLDNGPGFKAENIKKILEPYFTTKKEGLGMGLSISRTIIEAHGGSLIAKNNPQGGAWFQFTLPILREENDATE